MKVTTLVVLATFLLFCAFPAFCQTEAASVSGRVTDPSGAVLVGVTVQVQNVATDWESTTKTNSSGIYVVPALKPGKYRIIVTQSGFRQIVKPDVVLNVQDNVSINFSMLIGSTQETVTVQAGAPVVNTESAAVSTVVDQQFVENMPLNGRSFQSLIYAVPGVVITSSDPWGQTGFSANGQRTNSNYFTLDGVSANFGASNLFTNGGVGQTLGGTTPAVTSGGGTNSLVSVDAMQEFRIQTSSYAPEFGRSPGAQVSIVTKGGGNQWHGTAYDYLRNDLFDARSYYNNAGPSIDMNGNPLEPQKKPALRQNNFGGTLSGPLWKDHTFFFFSYEGLRLRQPNFVTGYFLDASAKAAVAAANSAWAPIVNATPTGTGALYVPPTNPGDPSPSPCDNVANPCMRQLNAAYSDPSSFDSYSLRLDQKLTDQINLFARYNHAPSNSDSLQSLNQNVIAYSNTDTATVGMTATITPTLVNDFRGNWSRQVAGNTVAFAANNGAVTPPTSVIPPAYANGSVTYLINIQGFSGSYTLGSSGKDTARQLNFVDTLSKSLGAHQLKFGMDFRRPSTFVHNPSSFYGIPFSWDSILAGYADFAFTNFAVPLTVHMHNWSFFGQDTWKVSPRLTMTYGLRWDINTPPVSDTAGKPLYTLDGVFNNNPLALVQKPLFHTYYGAISPRIGVAYQLTPKTTVRSGFGLFYDLPYGGGLSYAFAEPPNTASGLYFGVPVNDFTDPAYQQPPFTTDLNQITGFLTAVNPNLKPPVTYQWNVAVERELGKAQTLTVTYLGAHGSNLLYNAQLPSVSPDYAFGVKANLNSGKSQYNALQVQFMQRMSHGLQAMASYSYSHSNDTASNDYTASDFASISAIKLPPMTPSDYDIHQTLKAVVSYEIPKPAWGGRAGGALFGGWAVDGVVQKQTTPPLTVTIEEYDPVLGSIGVIASEVSGQPIWIKNPNEPAGKALNPAAFALAADGSSALALRNSIRSPYGIFQTDMALRRRFNITERVKLDFRAEYFNIFNHPMFGGSQAPATFWGTCYTNSPTTCTGSNLDQSAYFGRVYHGSNTGNSIVGQTLNVGLGSQASQYAPGGNRSAQFTLKLSF